MKNNLHRTICLAALAGLVSLNVWSQTGKEVMLQTFNWESCNSNWWTSLNGQVNTIAAAGIDVVWLPPASKSEGCQGYRPTEYYNINNSYGSQAQLKTLVTSFHGKSIKVLADIVINHREGSGSCQGFYNPDWGNWSICSNDAECPGSGATDSGENFNAGRELDHSNTGVQDGIKYMMKGILKDQVGIDGWRYDFSKGYDGKYVGIYNTASSPYMSVGEYWKPMSYTGFNLLYDQNAHRDGIGKWIDATGGSSTAFDFTTKGMLQEAVQYSKFSYLKDATGKPTGLIGTRPTKAVTFLDNHDSGGSQNHWPFHGDTKDQELKDLRVMMGYAYILTHPGIPCVFWDHLMTWKIAADIKILIGLRKEVGIASDSKITIEKAVDQACYGAIVEGSKEKLAVMIGNGTWAPTGNWSLAASGTNYKVYRSGTNNNAPILNVNPAGGTYIGGTTVTLTATGPNVPVKIYYTTDGSTPTTSSSSIASGGKVSITKNLTLKAIAVDALSTSSVVVANSYITQNSGFSVYFKKPADWISTYIYSWGPAPTYTAYTTAWPGTVMTSAGNGWYSYNFPTQPTVNIVFNNGMSGIDEKKTGDITNVTKELWYDNGIVTGLNSKESLITKVNISPNPANDFVSIQSSLELEKITITNILGDEVKAIEGIDTKELQVDLSDLTKGIYVFGMVDKEGRRSWRKVVKE